MTESASESEAEISGVQAGQLAPGTRGALQPVLALLMGLGFLEMAFWMAPILEEMHKELGVRLSQKTVIALQAATFGRSPWGISLAVGIVASSSWWLWRTRGRAVGAAMLWLAALAAVCALGYFLVLFLPLGGGILTNIR